MNSLYPSSHLSYHTILRERTLAPLRARQARGIILARTSIVPNRKLAIPIVELEVPLPQPHINRRDRQNISEEVLFDRISVPLHISILLNSKQIQRSSYTPHSARERE